MRPRFAADYRALVWAFVLFPLPPILTYARPELALVLLPFGLYFAFCSGVLAHNQNHCPVFRSRRWNTAYSSWLSVFYGCPLFAWIPTHNQNHHRYVNGPGDATRTTRHARRDSLLAALTYPFRSSAWQLPALVRYAAGAHRGAPGRLRRIVLELSALIGAHAALLALALALHGLRLGAGVYLLSVGLPALFAPWSMMLTNYLQHVGCEPGSQHNHSRNFVSPFWNWFVFDNGYHTAHHEQPGLHWSLYRALHQSRAARIDPRLNQRTPLAYCLEAYLLPLIGARRPRGGSAGMPAARSAQAPLPLSRPGAGRTLQAAPELAGK